MRSLLILAVCVLFSGCTRVAFTEPVGKPAPGSDLTMIPGDWTGEKGVVWHVEKEPGSEFFSAKSLEGSKAQNFRFVVTTVVPDVFILWVEDKQLNAFIPMRISAAEDALALLYPDEEEIKRIVEERKLPAVFDKEKNAWLFPKGDWESLLVSKAFWRLNLCLPFTKKKSEN